MKTCQRHPLHYQTLLMQAIDSFDWWLKDSLCLDCQKLVSQNFTGCLSQPFLKWSMELVDYDFDWPENL